MHTKMRTHLSQSTDGMYVVRAFQRENLIQNKTVDLINDDKKSDIVIRGAHEYFHKRLQWLSNLMYIFVGVVCISLRGSLEPIYIAMMFQYLEGISHSMNGLMHGYREIDENLRSLQKLLKLEDIKQEKDVVEDLEKIEVPEQWPKEGKIAFKDVTMRYRPETDIVLNKLSFEVEPNHKVGIVGRTGAGKSTLSMVLSRIIEVEGGAVEIDGLNTAQVPLEKVREKITVIPQDPVIFRDTIKFNLDPTGKVPDEEIIELLKTAGLEDLLKREPEKKTAKQEKWHFDDLEKDEGDGKGIYYKMNDGGDSLSVGEKQLLCICRAVLRKNKIVVLDEATANIDIVTEQKIYKLIDSAFKESTVLTIAHRLNTVLNSDRVLVLDEGKMVEYDDPTLLAKNPTSRLSKLLKEIKKKEVKAKPAEDKKDKKEE